MTAILVNGLCSSSVGADSLNVYEWTEMRVIQMGKPTRNNQHGIFDKATTSSKHNSYLSSFGRFTPFYQPFQILQARSTFSLSHKFPEFSHLFL